jgi:glycosyltransferase involved in cell wall biosynthesis
MPRADIVVLNDMHPNEFPGAASIAYTHAKYLSARNAVSFWHTTLTRSKITVDEDLEVRAIGVNNYIAKITSLNMFTRLVNEFTAPVLLFKITTLLIFNRPKIVWLNQIGVRIPRTIAIVLILLKIRVVQTFHDFGIISPRKLYPLNISSKGKIELSRNMIINSIYCIRRRVLIFFTCLNIKNICISDLQADIYRSVRVNKIEIAPNGIARCKCTKKNYSMIRPNEVLFAGRSTGKGFDQICRIVKNNPDWKLLAAGDGDLADSAKSYLSEIQFEYLGFLKPEELFKYIHQVKFVSVLSECFDVYPTIALESFMHNSKILATPTIGTTKLLDIHGGGIIIDSSNTDVDLDSLFASCHYFRNDAIDQISLDFTAQYYESIFRRSLFPTSH